MRIIFLLIFSLLSSATASAVIKADDSMPAIAQFLYIESLTDQNQSSSYGSKLNTRDALLPFFDRTWMGQNASSSPHRIFSRDHIGAAIVRHGTQSSSIKAIRAVKNVAAAKMTDIFLMNVVDMKPVSFAKIVSEDVKAPSAIEQVNLLRSILSPSTKARIANLTAAQRQQLRRNLETGLAAPFGALNLLEQEMMKAAHTLALLRIQHTGSWSDVEQEAIKILEKHSEIKYARRYVNEILTQVSELAEALEQSSLFDCEHLL